MDYSLSIDSAPETIPGGTGLLLVHPSTGETDRVDTEFLSGDTDHFMVVSTRTTAREVNQKIEHYEVDESKAVILDTLSVERGFTRRQREDVRYVSSPDDLDNIIDETRNFLDTYDGKRRISVDSLTEMIYYADKDQAKEAIEEFCDLLAEYDAVGLFHLARGVHDESVLEEFRSAFDGVIELQSDGSMSVSF